MKKLFVLLVTCSTLSMGSKAQDTTKVEVFGGLVGIGSAKVTNGEISKWASLRVGARITSPIIKGLQSDMWLAYDVNPDANFILFRFSLRKTWKNWGISGGYQPTPNSEIRPYPLSVDGQFEFTAEGLPPGGALGASAWYKNFKVGAYLRSGKLEYHTAYLEKRFKVGLWTTATKFGGATAQIDLPQVYAMASITGTNVQALALAIQPIKKIDYKLFLDFGIKSGRVSNCLTGIQHPIETKILSDARIGVAYDLITGSTGAFLIAGLNRIEKIAMKK